MAAFELAMMIATGDCAIHGHWEIESGSVNGKPFVTKCPECYQIQKNKEAEDAAKAEQQKIFDRQRSYGVTERHVDLGLESYIATTQPQKSSLAAVQEVLDSVDSRVMRNLIMIGTVGTGKTHLGQALVVEMARKWKPARYTTLARMIRFVRSTWDRDSELSEAQAYDKLTKPCVLVIDEVGVQSGTDNERNILFEVINERYESNKSTVIICNLTKDELVGALGDRTIDRLRENGRMIGMTWESARK